MNIIQPTTTAVKPAAIWARVSTSNQAETSLPSQIARCKEKLEAAGYSVIHTLAVDWTSDQLQSCPEFQQLRRIIKEQQIVAIGVYHRDRLPADEVDRLMFLRDCKKAGVQVIPCQGPEVVDGHSGFLMEFMDTWSKKEQVNRAREGSKTGLHDRATKFKKPVTFHKLFGYDWDKETLTLKPNEDWPTLKMVFDKVLAGSGYQPILDALAARGIPKNKTFISAILHNPVYAGRYFALKKVAVEPREGKRKGNTYGNSSVRKLPLEQAYHLPNIKIIDPPITWEQRRQIFDQLAMHQKLSQRNAKRNYLLRGMIFCETHKGVNGEPRAYHGAPHHKKWRYTCPVGGCEYEYLNGPGLEKVVTLKIFMMFLGAPDQLFRDALEAVNSTTPTLTADLQRLQNEDAGIVTKMAKLEDRVLSENIEPEVYAKLRKQYQERREAIKVHIDTVLGQVANQNHKDAAIKTFQRLKATWAVSLARNSKLIQNQPQDPAIVGWWREIFTELNVRVLIGNKDSATGFERLKVGETWVPIRITADLPIEITEGIELAHPGADIRNNTYPLNLALPDFTTVSKVVVGTAVKRA